MESDETLEDQVMDPGFDIEKRTRRSSILKRKSIIRPIDESSSEVFTSGKASRRVSFANTNFVKHFAADPEKTTIWDNTYEEEVNYSDSSKSVDSLGPGLLNVTSINIPEFEDTGSVEKAPCMKQESAINTKYIHYELAQGVKECDKENAIPLVKTVVFKNETVIFDRSESNLEFTGTYANSDFKVPKSIVEFVKNRPSQNKNLASNRTDFEMELTCCFPNNDSFKRAESSCRNSESPIEMKNTTICSTDDMEFTLVNDNPFSKSIESSTTIGVKPLSNNVQCSDEKKYIGQSSQINMSSRIGLAEAEKNDMEFTTNLCDSKQDLRDHRVIDTSFPEAEMEFTCNLTNFKPLWTCEQAATREIIQSDVVNNLEEADMEFTTNLAVPEYFLNTMALTKQPSDDNGSNDQMEYTVNLSNIKQICGPVNFTNECSSDDSALQPQQSVISEFSQAPIENILEETDMEFTTNLAVHKYFSNDIHTVTARTDQSSRLERNEFQDEMEYPESLKNTKQVSHPQKLNSATIDMEFTTNLAIPKYCSYGIQTATAKTDQSIELERNELQDKLKCLENLRNTRQLYNHPQKPNSEAIDMEFTTNLAIPKYFSEGMKTVTAKIDQSIKLDRHEPQDQIECPRYLNDTKEVYSCQQNRKFEESDMEFTTNIAVHKYSSSCLRSDPAVTDHSKQLEKKEPVDKMEFTANLKQIKDVYNPVQNHTSEEINDFTTNLAIYKQSSSYTPPVIAKSIDHDQPLFENKSEDMECTTVVPDAKHVSDNIQDSPSGNSAQADSTDTIQAAVGSHSKGVDAEFTIESAESRQQLNPTNSNQRFGELKSEDNIKRVQTSSQEVSSNQTTPELSIAVPNINRQTVDGNGSGALGTEFMNNLTGSREFSTVVQTTSTEAVHSTSKLFSEQPFSSPEMKRTAVQTVVERNNGKVEYKKDCAQPNPSMDRTVALENQVSNEDYTDAVLAQHSHKQVANSGNNELSNREDHKILYSEPGHLLLKHDELLPVFANNGVTPTTSFAMNFSNMSPCIEDTQQLIHATFSKPESIDVLLTGRKFRIKNRSESKNSSGISQLNDIPENFKDTILISAESTQPTNQDEESNKTCWDLANSSDDILSNITPEIVDVEESMSVDQEEVLKTKEDSTVAKESGFEASLESTRDSLDYQNYTMRSNRILYDIKKHLVYIEPDPFFEESSRRCEKLCGRYLDSKAWIKSFIENYRLPKIDVVDLEEYFKEESEDSSTSRMSDGLSNDEAEGQKRLSMPDLAVPKSLYERVCEAAERSGKYWQFVKSENDIYHFDGLFRSVTFKVHVHPELGIVYSIQACNKLAAESSPLAHYEAKVFELKLKYENLLPALGPKFDVFSLLDYICLCVDEIASFHKECHQLLSKYGSSHKLTVHSDNRVTFEILHFHFIIWWTVTIEMSVNNLGCKESVSAEYHLDEKVNEEEVKQIAENCPKGVNFLRCFIEKVDEYVQRIGRRIAWQRESRLKYMNC